MRGFGIFMAGGVAVMAVTAVGRFGFGVDPDLGEIVMVCCAYGALQFVNEIFAE